jgi:hypothetical protein
MKDRDHKSESKTDLQALERREWVARAVAGARRACRDEQSAMPPDDPDQALRDETKFV